MANPSEVAPQDEDRDAATPEEPEKPGAEERFWRGGGAVSTGGGTLPPEPGTTPAELEPEEETAGQTGAPPS